MSLNYILGRAHGDSNFKKLNEKLYIFMYMDDINISTKMKRKMESVIPTIRIYSQDKWMEFDIEKSAMLLKKLKKRKNGRNRTAKS